MTAVNIPTHLTSPEGYMKFLKQLGYGRDESASAIAQRFELSLDTAQRIFDETEGL